MKSSFYERPVVDVARELVGCVLTHGCAAGVIVETEAYHDSEPACHAFAGLTPRTATLFGPPGRAYVYRSYGIHACLNAVSEPVGVGAAVLIRALEHNGADLLRGPIEISPRPARWRDVEVSLDRRIGISKAMDLPWRFCAAGSTFLSRRVRAPG